VPALEIKDLHAWYGESHILHGVDLTVNRGEVVTLLGRNGAGRTTTMRAIMGLTGARKGSIKINGNETIGLPTHKIAHYGIGYCPEERDLLVAVVRGKPAAAARAGGRQRHERGRDLRDVPEPERGRARARGCRAASSRCWRRPHPAHRREPAAARRDLEGLAPVIVQALARMILMLKKKGYTVVMVEQNFRFAAPLADRFYVMEHGAIVERFAADELQAKMPVLNELLGV
jgi:branched-chain amino acid transport system ATP-binding protein